MVGHRLLRVGTQNIEIMRRQLDDPNSSFYSRIEPRLNPNDREDARIIAGLRRIVDAGVVPTNQPDVFNVIANSGLTFADIRRLGRGADDLWLSLEVRGERGPVMLVASEFIGWQGTFPDAEGNLARDAAGAATRDVTVDEWARQKGVTIQSRAETLTAGDQEFHIENPIGSHRMVRAGRTLTADYGAAYGSLRIMDADPDSRPPLQGRPILVGQDGELDVYIPANVLAQIRAGEPYRGNVVILDRIEEGRSDPKVFFVDTPQEAILLEAHNFDQTDMVTVPSDEFPTVAGVTFDSPVQLPRAYIENSGIQASRFVSMTNPQFEAYQHGLATDESSRNMSPVRWIERQFSTRAHFDSVFQGPRVTREDFLRVPQLVHTAEMTNGITEEYIRGVQGALRALGYLDQEPNGQLDDSTRNAIRALQGQVGGIGADGQLTAGTVLLLNRRIESFNQSVQGFSQGRAYLNEIEAYVLNNLDGAHSAAITAALEQANIRGPIIDDKGEFGAARYALTNFLWNPENAAAITQFRTQLEAANPATTDFRAQAPSGPTNIAAAAEAANRIERF